MAQYPGLLVRSGQAYLGIPYRRLLGSLNVNPNRITPLQLFEISRNLIQIFSLTFTGRELNAIPLQKLSTLRAIVPSLEMRMLSP